MVNPKGTLIRRNGMRGNDMRRTTTFAVIALLLTGLTACSPRPADPHPTAEPPTIEIAGTRCDVRPRAH